MTLSETFQSALREAMPRAYVAAYRRLGDRDAAQDVCQEAASRALRAQSTYDTSRPFYPWFYRIVQNLCRDFARHRRAEARTLDVDDQTVQVSDPRPGVEASLIHSEREAALVRAIAALPEDLREMIELRHFQDLSYQEMAEVLGCPKGTVMSRLYRARKALGDLLREEGGSR
ncbi:MAG: RNA polymerase sigma factor [Bradymonadia bacterium]